MFSRSVAEKFWPADKQERKAEISGASESSRGAKWLFTPVLAPMLQNRWMALVLTALGVSQIVLTALGLGVWRCPIHSALGIVCPGCGMTTAIRMLIEGKLEAAIRMHAFAPLVVGILILMAITGILPLKYRHQIIGLLAVFESRSGITAMVLIAMIVYWLLRTIQIS